ncbi:MAG: hypothetical protein QXV09_07630 [Candidatus Bathyarchaeia archaeon]
MANRRQIGFGVNRDIPSTGFCNEPLIAAKYDGFHACQALTE